MNACGTGTQQRRYERVDVRLDVHYGIHDLDRFAIAENVSEGGLYLNTNDVFPPGTRVILRIEFPKHTITQRGEVIWSIRAPEHRRTELMHGMGIQFLSPGAEWVQFLELWKESS